MAAGLSAATALILSLGPLAGTAAATPPIFSNPPVVHGNAWVGQTLTRNPADWNTDTFSDQWEDCDANGDLSSCQPVSANGTGTTYVIATSDLGDTIVDSETATADDGSGNPSAGAAVSAPTIVIAPPSNTSAPAINGTPRLNATLSASNGTWTHNPSFSYRWYDCGSLGSHCQPVASAGTAQTYTVGSGDGGQAIEVGVTACDDPNQPTTCATTNSAPVGFPVTASPPTIAGTNAQGQPVQGQALTSNHAPWSPTPDHYSYVWSSCQSSVCAPIQGAVGQSYTPTLADAGSEIELQETASYRGITSDPAASARTGVTLPQPPASVTPPTVGGTLQQDQTLTASPGTWSNDPDPSRYTYQWADCDALGGACADVPGATESTYRLTANDVGDTVAVRVQASNAGGSGAPTTASAVGLVQTSSTLGLSIAPGSAVVNQPVTLVATVSSRSANGPPSGSVRFTDQGVPIAGCANLPVSPTGESVTILCQSTFPAEQAQLAASFTAAAGSLALGSASASAPLTVGPDQSTTALDASATVKVHAATTFTATVAAPASRTGPTVPSGTVEFLDGGTPINDCTYQRLFDGGATCTMTYAQKGTHRITAHYRGDSNFEVSTSSSRSVSVTALPAAGAITATMQWTFHYTPSYTTVIAMVINGAPAGATVALSCHGMGCPFATRSRTVAKSGRVSLTSLFAGRQLRIGAELTIRISRPRYTGKYYRFTVRTRLAPKVQIACTAVGSSVPTTGC